jgi:hypothetical protein
MGIFSTTTNSWGILKIEKYLKRGVSVRAAFFPAYLQYFQDALPFSLSLFLV